MGTSCLVTTARMSPGWTAPTRVPMDRMTLLVGAGIAWLLLLLAGVALLML